MRIKSGNLEKILKPGLNRKTRIKPKIPEKEVIWDFSMILGHYHQIPIYLSENSNFRSILSKDNNLNLTYQQKKWP